MDEKNTGPVEGLEERPVLRNHPSVILGNLITVGAVLIFVAIIWASNGVLSLIEDPKAFVLLIILLIGLCFIFYRRWKLTTYTFGDTEITVDRNTVFKNKVHIQYSKLASVNVRRNIVNHLFGTTTLLFNVNSSINTAQAEASLTLKADEADRLREAISNRIFQREFVPEKEIKQESMVKVTNFDVILHGLFGQPTVQAVTGLLFLAYSFITVFWGNGSGVLLALLMFALTTALPWVRTILRYYNYRIYRVGDTITVESGLISNYRSSFKIKKVNAVRVREPLLARLLGKALLEAEVIGLADAEGLPLLCPLKGKRVVMDLGQNLIPEFLIDYEPRGQPKKAFVPTMAYRFILSAAIVLIGVAAYLFLKSMTLEPGDEFILRIATIADIALTVAIPFLLIVHGLLAHGHREFDMKGDVFMFVIGGYDRETDYIKFDKVQKTVVSAGIIQRRFGVARCTVSLMAASGFKDFQSGLFSEEELSKVPEEIMARIKDGRYDYRVYQ